MYENICPHCSTKVFYDHKCVKIGKTFKVVEEPYCDNCGWNNKHR